MPTCSVRYMSLLVEKDQEGLERRNLSCQLINSCIPLVEGGYRHRHFACRGLTEVMISDMQMVQ